MSGIFRYQDLRTFLKDASDRYRIWNLKDWRGGNGIVLRHDVDFDLRAALRMAELESSMGITSSFFIMTTSSFYNPSYRENREILVKMAGLGFDIGLHYDPTVYEEGGDDEENVRREADLLASICGSEVNSVSLHNPSVHGSYPLFRSFRNAYDPAIFSNETYASDSCMDFRGKDMGVFLTQAEKGPVQLLLHPMHYTENGYGYPEIMEKYVREVAETIDRDFAVNWKFSEQMKGRTIAGMVRPSPDERP